MKRQADEGVLEFAARRRQLVASLSRDIRDLSWEIQRAAEEGQMDRSRRYVDVLLDRVTCLQKVYVNEF